MRTKISPDRTARVSAERLQGPGSRLARASEPSLLLGVTKSENAASESTLVSSGPGALSTAVGDYLKAIWHIAGDGVASTGDIARELDVTAPSVTGMLGKLAGLGLVDYQPYRGAGLSRAGRAEALRLIRRHRLLETFLIRDLAYGWDEVHDEAELMEHTMSERFTERLARYLGQPQFDPHGDPIPRRDGTLPDGPDKPLVEADEGRVFTVHRVLTQDGEVLAYLARLGIEPGCELEVVGREPHGHLLRLKAGGREMAISRELASLVLGGVR